MRLEDHFKDVMRRTVANEPPVVDAWSRFEDKAKRTRRLRLVWSLAGAATVVAVALVAVPRVLPERAVVPPASPEPSPSFSVDPMLTWETYTHANEGWEMSYPPDWRIGGFEGGTEFLPPGMIGLAAGGQTFGVELMMHVERFDDRTPQENVTSTSRGTLPSGRPYVLWEGSGREGETTVTYWIDWPTEAYTCPEGAAGCDMDPLTLRATIYAGTQDLRDRFGDTARLMIETIAVAAPKQTQKRGTVAPGVQQDGLTTMLVDFLEARLDRRGAEEHLSANAKSQYDANEGGLSLYSPTSNPHYARYEILSREGVDANSVEFVVRITEEYTGQTTSSSFLERIGAGPGQNHAGTSREAVVRFAQRCADTCP